MTLLLIMEQFLILNWSLAISPDNKQISLTYLMERKVPCPLIFQIGFKLGQVFSFHFDFLSGNLVMAGDLIMLSFLKISSLLLSNSQQFH